MGNNQKPLTGINPAPKYVVPQNNVTVNNNSVSNSEFDVVASSASSEATLGDLSAMSERTGREILEILIDIRKILLLAVEEL